MFDIGFPELLLVSIVALLVIGPEKLPQTIRTMSLWLGRLKRSLANIKADIEAEIGADEIRQQIHNESVLKELKNSKEQLEEIVTETKSGLNELAGSAKNLTRISPASTDKTQDG
jgi:sec-independent protein translocase protein TatB